MIWRLVRALLFLLPPETAHGVGALGLRLLNLLSRGISGRPKITPVVQRDGLPTLGGIPVASRLGLAAGFDKDGKYLPALGLLGFGFAEIGSVTPQPQPGNPRPRMFRLPHSGALINRLGFNSEGAVVVAERLARLRGARGYPFPVGINLGKNRETKLEDAAVDYLAGMNLLQGVADFFVVNVSSPNTPGLRKLLDKDFLKPLVGALAAKGRELGRGRGPGALELFLKISPDMSAIERRLAVDLAMEAGFAGIVATNTSVRRDLPGVDVRDRRLLAEEGGLSGAPLRELSAQQVAEIRGWLGKGLKLISVGGIADAAEARRRIAAGADLVEVYTGFIYGGPALPRRLGRALALP